MMNKDANNNNANAINTTAEEILPPSPGRILRKAREAQNVPIDVVAKKLLISKERVLDLENDDYTKFAASVYVRGYLLAYAHFLQIDENIVMKSFNEIALNNKHEFAVLRSVQSVNMEKGKKSLWAIYAVIVISVVLVVFLWQRHKDAIAEGENSAGNPSATMTTSKITTSDTNTQTMKSDKENNNASSGSNANNAASSINSNEEMQQAPLLQKVENIPRAKTADTNQDAKEAPNSVSNPKKSDVAASKKDSKKNNVQDKQKDDANNANDVSDEESVGNANKADNTTSNVSNE